MNQPTHRERAEDYLQRAAEWLDTTPGNDPTAAAIIGTGHAVLAHLDALALPEPGTADVILDAARKLTDELGSAPDFHARAFAEAVQDHDHGGLTPGADDHAQTLETPAPSVAGATNPGAPVSLDVGNGSGDLTAVSPGVPLAAADALSEQIWEANLFPGRGMSGNEATAIVNVVLAAGWRPPLPDGGQALAEQVAGAIADALAVHSWDGGDHSNHPLSTFAEVATAAVMPFLEEPPAAPAEDSCEHCSPTHERPESRPWGVYVAPHRDGDGQPTHLVVQPSNGAHVAQSDADWLWQLIRAYRPPAEARVFLPGDVVPAGLWVSYRTPEGLAAAMGAEDWMAMDGAVVELDFPSLADWQAAVDRASAERREREQAHTALLKADLGADVAREHGVLPADDQAAEESTSDTTPDRFYGFTDHGHPVGPKPDDVEAPDLVARCGALAGCPSCRADAGRLRQETDRG